MDLLLFDNYFAVTAGLVFGIALLSENSNILRRTFIHPRPAQLNDYQKDESARILTSRDSLETLKVKLEESDIEGEQDNIESSLRHIKKTLKKINGQYYTVLKPVSFITKMIPSDSALLFRHFCLLSAVYCTFILLAAGYCANGLLVTTEQSREVIHITLFILGCCIQILTMVGFLIEMPEKWKSFLVRLFPNNAEENKNKPLLGRHLLLRFIINILTITLLLLLVLHLRKNYSLLDGNLSLNGQWWRIYIFFATPVLPIVIYLLKNNTIPSSLILLAKTWLRLSRKKRNEIHDTCNALRLVQGIDPDGGEEGGTITEI